MTVDGFVQKFSSDVHEIAKYMEGQNSEEKLAELFALHQRHAQHVSQVMKAKFQENVSSVMQGILPDTCLLSMVARGEHLRVDEILKVDKSKKKHKTKKRRRRISSELSAREQEAYTLVYIQNKTPKQAAIEMGCSPQNISKLLKKAETKLKAQRSRSVSLKKSQQLPEDRRSQVNISKEDI
jgi:RNA polymerase sigma factor (sigma-70 family)